MGFVNTFKTVNFMKECVMRESYELVMDEKKNPLQRLPKAQRFQVMVFLSSMWTTVFCLAIGSYAYWGELILGHVALGSGVLITALTFRTVSKRTHRDLDQGNDGTAK
jgi:hypothetical protein